MRIISLLGVIVLLGIIIISPIGVDATKATSGSAKMVCGDRSCSEPVEPPGKNYY